MRTLTIKKDREMTTLPELKKQVKEMAEKGCSRGAIQDYKQAQMDKDLNGLGSRVEQNRERATAEITAVKVELKADIKEVGISVGRVDGRIGGIYKLLLVQALGFIAAILIALLVRSK